MSFYCKKLIFDENNRLYDSKIKKTQTQNKNGLLLVLLIKENESLKEISSKIIEIQKLYVIKL